MLKTSLYSWVRLGLVVCFGSLYAPPLMAGVTYELDVTYEDYLNSKDTKGTNSNPTASSEVRVRRTTEEASKDEPRSSNLRSVVRIRKGSAPQKTTEPSGNSTVRIRRGNSAPVDDHGFSSSEVTSQSGGSLGAVDLVTEPDQPYPDMSIGQASRKVLATHFQSCQVLDAGVGIEGPFSANHAQAIKDLPRGTYPDGAQCVDRRGAGFGYQTGGRARMEGGRLNVFRKLDCSGAALAFCDTAGLKITVDRETGDSSKGANTQSFFAATDSQKGCFTKPTVDRVDPQTILQPGDILNHIDTQGASSSISNRHMITIDAVGEDPLGILQVGAQGCSGLTESHFNFSFIHSSSYKRDGFNGLRRVHGSRVNGANRNGILAYAKRACVAYYKKRPFQSEVYSVQRSRTKTHHVKFQVMRHLGENKPGCVGEPLKLKNEGCVDGKCNDKIFNGEVERV